MLKRMFFSLLVAGMSLLFFYPATSYAADSVAVVNIFSDSAVIAAGQSFFVHVGIQAGDTDVVIDADSWGFTITDTEANRYDTVFIATCETPTLPDTIAAGNFDTFIFLLTFLDPFNKHLQIDMYCTGGYGLTGATQVTGDSFAEMPDTILITPEASVTLLNVYCDSEFVIVGQNIFVQVGILAGSEAINIHSTDLSFIISDTLGNRYDTVIAFYGRATAFVGGDTINANSVDTLTYLIGIPLTMDTGTYNIDAIIQARYFDTAGAVQMVYDTYAVFTDTWTITTGADVSFVSLTIHRYGVDVDTFVVCDTASARSFQPDSFTLQACLYNSGEGTARIAAETTYINILNSLGADVTASFVIDTYANNPTALAGNSYDTWIYWITIPDSTTSTVMGSITVGIAGAAGAVTDSTTGGAITPTRTADTPTIDIYFPVNTVTGETIGTINGLVSIYIPAGKLSPGTELTMKFEPTSAEIAASIGTASE